jgi:hypothetical protein
MEARAQELTQLIALRSDPKPDRGQALSEQAEQLAARERRLQEHNEHFGRISEQLSSLAIQLNAVVVEVGEMDVDAD